MWAHRVHKASRLTAVDCLGEGAMQKRVLDIQLMNGPRARDGDGEDGANSSWLDHRAESPVVVDTEPLGEATKDPACLVPFQCAVRVELVFEDPFAGDDVGASRARN